MTSWKNWIGVGATVVLLTVSSCASWTPEQRQNTELGAAAGAFVGGGIGCGIAASIDYDDPTSYAIGCPIGVGAGAILGGLLGYYLTRRQCLRRHRRHLHLRRTASAPPPPVRQKLVLRGVHFDFNKSKIRPGDAAILDEAASTLKANPNVTVNVNGYCDAIGSEEYNLKLSDRRSDAVVDYLTSAGIPWSQLIPHGYGKTNFVATNDTAEGRAQNRRVELEPND